MSRSARFVCAVLLVAGAVGCGGVNAPSGESQTSYVASAGTGLLAMNPSEETAGTEGTEGVPEARVRRRIIYTAKMMLDVVDFEPVAAQVVELAQRHGGFVASSDIQGSVGSSRYGQWTLRVPVEQYPALLQGAAALGELRSRSEDSQDVTEEFVDLEARQSAKQEEETRMLRHLHESTEGLDQILAVERELARVRTEREQIQGRLRVLADRTELCTLTLIVREVQTFTPRESPALGTRIARTWHGSVELLQRFGEALLHCLIALAPWLVVASPVVALMVIRLRRRRPLAVRGGHGPTG